MPSFPALIDVRDLDGTNGFRIQGGETGAYSGWSVASAGDINGDGFDDVVVGAPRHFFEEDGYSGEAYVVFGRASGFPDRINAFQLDGTNGFRLMGIDPGDHAGLSVASAGDVNGDGIDDLIIGAPGPRFPDQSPSPATFTGESYVVFGRTDGFSETMDLAALDGSNGFRLDGVEEAGFSGFSVASAGDINGDGFDDVIVGAYFDSPGGIESGASYVVFGQADGFAASIDLSSLDGSDGFRLAGIDPGDRNGHSVASAGDVNNDGFDDLIIGAPGGDPGGDTFAGESYVVFGHGGNFTADFDLAALNGSNGFRVDGIEPRDEAGFSVASAGDVNGDGFDDVIIGSYRAHSAYVVFGRAAGLPTSIDLAALDGNDGFVLYGEIGLAVASAGDVNGDGYDDLIVAAHRYESSPTSGPESYVIFGHADGFTPGFSVATVDGTNGFAIDGSLGLYASWSAASAGDVNNDGFDDVIVGSPYTYAPNRDRAGLSSVIFGRAPDEGVTRTGSAGGQTILGGAFADSLSGLGGDDFLEGLGGDDLLDGGDGFDMASYEHASGAIQASLAKPGEAQNVGAGAGLDTLVSVEGLLGSAFDDRLYGNGEANRLTGAAGNDQLVGQAGDDRLLGQDGNDVLNGGAGADRMAGGAGDDSFYVDDAGDTVVEKAGEGIDEVRAAVDYVLADQVEKLVLVSAARSGTGNALDNTAFGTGGADILSGLAGDDTLRGKDGRDTLLGGDGADLLDGGVGKDLLTGGAGRDVFQFRDGDLGTNRSLADTIADFSQEDNEKIQLQQVDADTTLAGDQAFTWIGDGAFSGAAGQLHYAIQGGATYVEGDTNGDGMADFAIALTGILALDASDFVL